MNAGRAYREHASDCGVCSLDGASAVCKEGDRQFKSFGRLQDAHINRLGQQNKNKQNGG
ncbi:hypothetical protein [Streptomyces scopuliridis]|uniref:hypothetical protein n=1 Tax=Streptomyces scopuliridis TaxID=452529 RepID=UPI0036966290